MRRFLIAIPVLALFFLGCKKEITFDEECIEPLSYSGENYTDYEENQFVNATEQAVSTFSIDADGGAYSNMRRFLAGNQLPPKEAVRIEEFINFFEFDYPNPTDENVSISTESCQCPWTANHFLLRIGLKGVELTQRPPSNFVFLIDVSGSMDSADKLGLLKDGFKTFANQLTSADRIAIVTYAGEAGVLLNSTAGNNTSSILKAIDKLGAGGSTAGADGIITAYEIAEQSFIEGGNNRVILGSDGDFNVGPASTQELVSLIEEKRKSGIYLTVLGVGTGNLNDAMMEQLANNGNGTYEYIDNAEQICKVFIYEYNKFFSVATDAKIQIAFNAEVVEYYRLIGYENRILENDDFENDSVDAGEIGAGQTITALYEIVTKAGANAETFGNLDFRYKRTVDSESCLIAHVMKHQPTTFAEASENMRFVAAVASFGMILKHSEFVGSTSFEFIRNTAHNARRFDPHGYRAEFEVLVEKASKLK